LFTDKQEDHMTIDKIASVEHDQPLVHRNTDQRYDLKARAAEAASRVAEVELPDPEKVRAILAESDISLNFHRDDDTGRIVVEMIDNVTGEAIRQLPTEVSLRLSELFSKVQGNIFEARV
jgi:uncharacterized FlaG/YvyC family protein